MCLWAKHKDIKSYVSALSNVCVNKTIWGLYPQIEEVQTKMLANPYVFSVFIWDGCFW